jgi:hypothetical protein
VSGSVGSSGTSVCLSTFTIVERLSTESTLVDLSLLRTGEWDSVVLKLEFSAIPFPTLESG